MKYFSLVLFLTFALTSSPLFANPGGTEKEQAQITFSSPTTAPITSSRPTTTKHSNASWFDWSSNKAASIADIAASFLKSFVVVDCFDGKEAYKNYNYLEDAHGLYTDTRKAGVTGITVSALKGIYNNPTDAILLTGMIALSGGVNEYTPYLKLFSESVGGIKRLRSYIPTVTNSRMSTSTKCLVTTVIILYCLAPTAAAASDTPFFGESFKSFQDHFSSTSPCKAGPALRDIKAVQSCTGWNWFMNRNSLYECRDQFTETPSKTSVFLGEYHRSEDGVVRTTYTPGEERVCFFSSLKDGVVVKSCYIPGQDNAVSEVVKGYSLNDMVKGLEVDKIKQIFGVKTGAGISGCGGYQTAAKHDISTTSPVCINYRVPGQTGEAELCFNPQNPSELTLKDNPNPIIPDNQVSEIAEGEVASKLTIYKPPCKINFWSAVKAWWDQTSLECENIGLKNEL